MAVNNMFTKVIEQAFQKKVNGKDHKLVPSVSKQYKTPTKSVGKLEIETEDADAFKLLVSVCVLLFIKLTRWLSLSK